MKSNLKNKKTCKLHCTSNILHGGTLHDVPEALQNPDEIVPVKKEISVDSIIDVSEEQMTTNIPEEQIAPLVQQLPWMDTSKVQLYTIPIGTVLYHGSRTIDTFDVQSLKLSSDTNVIFFSPNINIAKSYIHDCSPEHPTGWVHKFIVSKLIDKIYIISASETSAVWQEELIEKKFCNNDNHDTCYEDLHGIGFFISSKDTYNSEFALCKPLEFLQYQGRAHCNGARILSSDFEMF